MNLGKAMDNFTTKIQYKPNYNFLQTTPTFF